MDKVRVQKVPYFFLYISEKLKIYGNNTSMERYNSKVYAYRFG